MTTRAAALRSVGVGPSGTPVEGAAPIPVPPAAVRAVADAPADTFTADRRGGHLARTALLRSRIQGDLSGVARMPSAVAARLRTTTVPAHLGALSAARATVRRPGPDARGSATPAPTRPGAVRR
ncbi:hypothetical protein [Streptomyces sp. AC602_WCS936]|uniref:hypothetical protein n=1 Tax=Streptomyces sp. AC602_WCS936 TaxID=2823685 RepID=UPI001C274BDC|nr:hypothetical protein [Streptomyces sp. AC602_WCS936]